MRGEIVNNRDVGLVDKYEVKRVDGKLIEQGCVVLEFKDKNARAGIKAFSKTVRAEGYIVLADDIDKKLKGYEIAKTISHESGSAIEFYDNGDVVIRAAGSLTIESGVATTEPKVFDGAAPFHKFDLFCQQLGISVRETSLSSFTTSMVAHHTGCPPEDAYPLVESWIALKLVRGLPNGRFAFN
jgi:hypothetical protein